MPFLALIPKRQVLLRLTKFLALISKRQVYLRSQSLLDVSYTVDWAWKKKRGMIYLPLGWWGGVGGGDKN